MHALFPPILTFLSLVWLTREYDQFSCYLLYYVLIDKRQFMQSEQASIATTTSLTTDATVLGDYTPLERIIITSSGNLQRVIRYCLGLIYLRNQLMQCLSQ